MARIKYGPIITSIRGSVGGATFQQSRYGNILRAKPMPLRKYTAAHQLVKSNMLTVQQAWRSLSVETKLQWSRYVQYSKPAIARDKSVLLAGHDLYVKYQMFRLTTKMSLLSSLNYVPFTSVPVMTKIYISGSDLTIQFSPDIYTPKFWFLLKMSQVVQDSSRFKSTGLKYIYTLLTGATDYNIGSEYEKLFGSQPVTGDYVNYSLRMFATNAPLFNAPIKQLYKIQ